MINKVRPKKSLGQHFLHDKNTAKKIVDALVYSPGDQVLEIGPGMGVLTMFLMEKESIALKVVEIDRESVQFLKTNFKSLTEKVIEGDFLEQDLNALFEQPFSVIGNFPYNISSQIFFHILEYRDKVTQVVCMLQKEVADRIASKHGNKVYGILSVLLQAYYDIKLVLKVPPGAFTPPPNVMSAVIRLTRNNRKNLGCNEKFFVQVVKQGFNNRRKTLRNALKNLTLSEGIVGQPIFDKRAEQLSVEDFIQLTNLIEKSRAATGI